MSAAGRPPSGKSAPTRRKATATRPASGARRPPAAKGTAPTPRTAKAKAAPASGVRRRPPSPGPRRRPGPGRRIAAGLAVSFVLVLVLLVGVFPTRDWWDQRQELRQRQEELARQEAEATQLEERISVLKTEEEVERMAREEFGMVRPGEEAFQVMDPPVARVELPDTWPFQGASDWLNR